MTRSNPLYIKPRPVSPDLVQRNIDGGQVRLLRMELEVCTLNDYPAYRLKPYLPGPGVRSGSVPLFPQVIGREDGHMSDKQSY